MVDKALDRVIEGGKTAEGKIISILLVLSLSLMAWSPFTIKTAFAGDGEGEGATTELVDQATIDGEQATDELTSTEGDPQGGGEEAVIVGDPTDSEATGGEEAAGATAPEEGDQPEAVGTDTESADAVDADIADEGAAAEADKAAQEEEAAKAAAEAEHAKAFPEQRFNDDANGITVNVTAPVGALPAGAKMIVTPVASENVEGAIANALPQGTTAKSITAVDITFTDAEGVEIEPLLPVNVTLRSWSMASADDPVVVHVDKQGAGDIVADQKASLTTMEFNSDKFSVYAVVETVTPRLTVTFKNGSTTIETMYIKAADTAAEVDEILYDPGAGTVPAGQVFKGWTIANADGTYPTAEDGSYELLTIAEVRADAMARAAALNGEDGEVTYTAALFKQYKVDYVDGGGIALGSTAVEIPSYETEAAYTVNMYYATDDSHNLEGWIVPDTTSQGHIKNYPDGATTEEIEGEMVTYYPNGTDITITGDVVFAVEAPAGYWLVFDENGKGATYNAPRFIKAGDVTKAPTVDMVRNGYTFGGWYKDAACTDGQEFTFGGHLTAPTTVYAKWTAKNPSDYMVIIWKQNIAGDGYDFGEAIHLSGTTGSTINTVTQQGTGDAAYARINNRNYQYEGFHLTEFDEEVTITPEDNAVVNVFYDRNEYTLTFKDDDSSSGIETRTKTYRNTSYTIGRVANGYYSSAYYVQIDNKWYQITSSYDMDDYLWSNSYNIKSNNGHTTNVAPGGTIWTQYGNGNNNNYTWRSFSIASTPTEIEDSGVYKTITALYGQPIGENFPITENGADDEWRWDPQDSDTFDQVLVYIDIMPAENVTFYPSTSSASTKYMEFYVEALPGQAADRSFNGKSFVKYGNTIPAKYNFFTESEDFINLTGYAKYGSDPAFNNGRADVSAGGTLRLYYTRNVYSINFMDGAYVDGNGNPITDQPSQGQITTVDDIAYQADVSSYNDFVPTTSPAGYVFEGWYLDSAGKQPYTFTTMPEDGMTVYAKWRQIQYRVFLHPNAGTDTTLDWGSDDQSMNFRIAYGGKVSAPEGQRTGYEWYGWYTDEEGTQPFAEATVLNDQTVTSTYDKTTDFTDPMDKWGNGATYNSDITGYEGGDRFWITKKLDLYGKWSAVILGAEGIGVIYDANGGSSAPSDNALYKDSANVTAGAASKAPANKQFSHWVLQTWNGSAYVDTETTLTPGEHFAISKDNAKITDTATGEIVDPDDVVETGHYNYTVQLKAMYKDVEEETPTFINWYDNYNSDNDGKGKLLQENKDIKINEAVDICSAPTRTGYTFLGWTKTKGGTTADFLVWDGTKYKTTIDGSSYDVTQVAADEKEPIEDVYAVWEAIEYTVVFDKNAEDATGEMADQAFTYDEEKALTTNAFQRAHYTFLGWNTAADGSGTGYNDAQVVKNLATTDGAEVTLYAQWEPIKYPYTIHHYLKGTTTQVADDVIGEDVYGAEVTATPVTTYQGKDLTVDSYNPSQKITIAEDGNVITIYYTLPLTITAKTDSKTYDGTPLNGAYTVTGELSSDTAAIETALGTAPSITNVSESPKNYLTEEDQAAITGIPSYYVVTYTPGTLNITKAEITVTLNGSGDEQTYTGSALTSDTKVTPSCGDSLFDASKFSYTGATTITETNVGNYSAAIDTTKAAYDDANLEVTFKAGTPVTFEITKAKITITADDLSKVYGTPDPELTATVAGKPAKGVDPVYTVTRDRGENAGDYTVTVTADADANPNYDIVTEDGTFTIEPADVSERFEVTSPEDTVYNGSEQKQPVTVKDTLTGETLTEGKDFELTYTDAEGGDDLTNAGTKTVTITGMGNYKGTVTKTYDITAADVTVKIDDQEKDFDNDPSTDPELTYTVEGLQGQDTEDVLGIQVTREEGQNAGEYAITATTVDNPNYNVTVEPGKLNIKPVMFHLTFNPNGGTLFGSPDIYTMDVEVGTAEGTDVTIVEAAVRTGYKFLYWRGSEYQPGDTYTVTVETGDHAFTAEWEKDAPILPKTGDNRGTLAGLMGAASLLSLFALVVARRRMSEDDDVIA